MIRMGDEGNDLVGSSIQVKSGKISRWGTMNTCCNDTHLHTVDMQDRNKVTITCEQVREHWMSPSSHSRCTRADQDQLEV